MRFRPKQSTRPEGELGLALAMARWCTSHRRGKKGKEHKVGYFPEEKQAAEAVREFRELGLPPKSRWRTKKEETPGQGPSEPQRNLESPEQTSRNSHPQPRRNPSAQASRRSIRGTLRRGRQRDGPSKEGGGGTSEGAGTYDRSVACLLCNHADDDTERVGKRRDNHQ